ncbi:DsbA family protein [Vibrio rumoiensis]|uniref:Protein-disulfide isomerase n=1 Tax=Vibrio rumoiensis 1S-45 TaxID=1188252 RepID=A0A1E5E5P5_9VIBR|nr:DsbA family protein [Vibrio rumoiensis]OEF29072.1 protein-disulfide isomerase [Vibrio rumoiensis 1S-45]
MVTIHYFYDPMCGWCYGATALIESIVSSNKFKLLLHPGGMLPGKTIAPSFRQHILNSDQRIQKLTGTHFGKDYVTRVMSNEELILDSYLPTRAILVGESLGLKPFEMLKAIQKAHYIEGKPVNTLSSLEELAVQLGLDQQLWQEKMQTGEALEDDAISISHQLMTRLNVQGYPTLMIEDKGQFKKIPHTEFYGREEQWKTFLEGYLNTTLH